jgi:hypothetical protein
MTKRGGGLVVVMCRKCSMGMTEDEALAGRCAEQPRRDDCPLPPPKPLTAPLLGDATMTEPTEFDCLDCGHRIVSYASAVSIDRCASCRWIRANVPPEDQPAARERLGVPLHNLG